MASLLMALAAAAAAPPAPAMTLPAPVLARVPVITTVDTRITPTEFDVEVRQGSELLWSGMMRVAGSTGASYSRNATNAPRGACTGETGYDGGERSTLSVNLRPDSYRQQPNRVSLQLSYDRPADYRSCDEEPGSRTVGLAQAVTIAPGASVTVTGDAGLSVRLRRR